MKTKNMTLEKSILGIIILPAVIVFGFGISFSDMVDGTYRLLANIPTSVLLGVIIGDYIYFKKNEN